MKTAEQIAEEYAEKVGATCAYHDQHFIAALKEYGAAVRQRAAGVAGRAASEYEATKDAHERNSRKAFDHRDFGFNMDVIAHSQYCAAAIERMELP